MGSREPNLFISSSHADKAAVEFLNELFHSATKAKASDIHLLFEDTYCEIKFRLDGALRRIDTVDRQTSKVIDEKIRSRSNMSNADRHVPLDGRMRLVFDDRTIDVRVSLVPTIGGQKIVCRLLDQTNAAIPLDSIYMTDMTRFCIDDIIAEPNGLLVVSGPTGSGKTTTLYAILNALNIEARNLITIEQPVEYTVKGITQINVDQHISFAGALRAILRQDPDIILVGEIRDAETAQIAVQAAITGHFVVATLHANNSALAITRLVEYGVDRQTLAAALRGVLAQRLVRRINPAHEIEWAAPNEMEDLWMNGHRLVGRSQTFPSVHFREQLAGPAPIIEMIRMDAKVRLAILANRGELPIFNAAGQQPQFETLAQAGMRMAAMGITTLDQVRSVVGEDPSLVETKRLGQVLIEHGFATLTDIDSALSEQVSLRRQGRIKMLGEILLEHEVCTEEQITFGIGFTEGAPQLCSHFVLHEKLSATELGSVVREWREARKGESIFSLLIEKGFISKEELRGPSIIHCAGRCVTCAAGTCERTESGSSEVALQRGQAAA